MKQLSKMVDYSQYFIGFSLEKGECWFHNFRIPSYLRFNLNLLTLKYLHRIYE